jgi:hypothetical protein
MGSIAVRRGNKADLPILASGEPGFAVDEQEVFIGTGSSNIRILTSDDLLTFGTTAGSMCEGNDSRLVDDVLTYASTANFPATGVSGIIYIAENTNLLYRWDTTTEDYILLGEIPTTPAPTFTVTSVSMNEMAESSLTIQNYDADNTYTVESLDTAKATVARSGSSFVITTEHVASNTSVSVRIKATAPEYLSSDWTTITVNISTITFYADDAIQVVDFTDEALYSTNWSLV